MTNNVEHVFIGYLEISFCVVAIQLVFKAKAF
jgi:hypothetical protein